MIRLPVILMLVFLFLSPALGSAQEPPRDNAADTISLAAGSDRIGPDYEVRDVEVLVAESTTSPGGVLHPSVRVANTGSDDIPSYMVTVSAFLGNITLVPVNGAFQSLPAGQETTFSLEYKIPETIDFGGYTFSILIDPDQTHDINISNNMKKAGGMVSITPPDDDSFIGCEACWEGYR
ncbi:hypothetical protein [Methanospirillum sp.]|uniref:hypothetical protein n=2 Tax=Methanospirillum sp. TaxID=45200 RepID=UPI002B587386|nr:hypothetical protein [Methanospirillum sp.]HOL40243.1 hypothetical protein [Methanospirillum sp.]HPP77032.1 hypothetical protein [Methanospirillum sp.]